MTILLVAALPLVAALVVLMLQRVRWPASTLTIAALVGMAILAFLHVGAAPVYILGRPFLLTATAGYSLVVAALLMAAPFATSRGEQPSATVCAVTLAAMAVVAVAVMSGNRTLAAILLSLGTLIAALLIPLQHQTRSKQGMQTMLIGILLAPLLLLAASALDTETASGGAIVPPEAGLLLLGVGLALGLGAFPFHAWVTREFREGTEISIVMLAVVLGLCAFSVASSMANDALLSLGPSQGTGILILVGIASAIVGGLGAISQHTFSGIIAYAAMADLGIVFIGMALVSSGQAPVGTLHLWSHALAVTACAMARAVFDVCLGGESEHDIRGAMQQAPRTLLGAAAAGLSLAGLPLTAGFATRLVVYGALADLGPAWAVAVTLSSLGPIWSMWRWLRPALAAVHYPGKHREPRGIGLLVLLMGLGLVLLGFLPGLSARLSLRWADGALMAFLG